MAISWVLVALVCAGSLAVADVLTRKYCGNLSTWQTLLVRIFYPGLLLLPFLIVYPIPQLSVPMMSWMALLVVLELTAMYCYVSAIKDHPLHLTLPYLAFTPVFNVLTGYVILDERVSWFGFTGIILVVLGSYLLNIKKDMSWRHIMQPLQAIWVERGSRLMLIAASLYSLTSIISKKVMLFATPETFGFFYFVVIGFATALFVLIRQPKSFAMVSGINLSHVMIAVCMAIMVFTHFIAISMVEAAYMIAVKRSSMLIAILLSVIFLHEKNINKQIFAAIIMFLGIIVVSLV